MQQQQTIASEAADQLTTSCLLTYIRRFLVRQGDTVKDSDRVAHCVHRVSFHQVEVEVFRHAKSQSQRSRTSTCGMHTCAIGG